MLVYNMTTRPAIFAPPVLGLFGRGVLDFFMERFPDGLVSHVTLLVRRFLPGCQKARFAFRDRTLGFCGLAHSLPLDGKWGAESPIPSYPTRNRSSDRVKPGYQDWIQHCTSFCAGCFHTIQSGTARQLFRSGAASILPPYCISSSVASRTITISSLKITSRPHSGLLPSIVTVLASTLVTRKLLV